MVKFLNDFEVEEQEVLNQTTQNEDLRVISRQDVIKKLSFVLAINKDEDIYSLYEGLKSKLLNLTDEDWTKVRDVLPFNLLYSVEDNETSDESSVVS